MATLVSSGQFVNFYSEENHSPSPQSSQRVQEELVESGIHMPDSTIQVEEREVLPDTHSNESDKIVELPKNISDGLKGSDSGETMADNKKEDKMLLNRQNSFNATRQFFADKGVVISQKSYSESAKEVPDKTTPTGKTRLWLPNGTELPKDSIDLEGLIKQNKNGLVIEDRPDALSESQKAGLLNRWSHLIYDECQTQ